MFGVAVHFPLLMDAKRTVFCPTGELSSVQQVPAYTEYFGSYEVVLPLLVSTEEQF